MGIPVNLLRHKIDSMIKLVVAYGIGGLILVVFIALIFSIKETLALNKLINVVSSRTKILFNNNNEFTYINKAVLEMDEVNKQQVNTIARLNNSIQEYVLENLFLFGVDTEKEEREIIKYFDDKFKYFYVIVFKIEREDEVECLQNTIIEINNRLTQVIHSKFEAISLSNYELVVSVFLDQCTQEEINREKLKEQLIELIHQINKKLRPIPIINIAISQEKKGMKKIREAYLEAKDTNSLYMDQNVSGVHIYKQAENEIHETGIDMALLIKCYDAILAGNQIGVVEILEQMINDVSIMYIEEHERLQFLFSLRQPIYNAYLKIAKDNKDERIEHVYELLKYTASDNIKEIILSIRKSAILLCEVIEENKKINSDRLKQVVITYIENNYNDVNLSAANISAEIGISQKYIFAIAKECTGKTLGNFIEDLRIREAEELLKTTDYPNTKIGKMVGFGSDNTFYRCFAKKHGISPTVWRKNYYL